ncbi:glycosyltransferase family 2 protein, partial [Staphylococcus shinii]
LALGIYNIIIIYDKYKVLNVKYGFTKKIENSSTIATIYPTINGNLALKVKYNE